MSTENTQTRDLFDTISDSIIEALSNTHTVLIAKVVAVNDTTINVRPVINRKVNGESIKLPVFPYVPPIFLQGGSSYTAHPIAIGDYCLLLINERCFDKWYHGSDYVNPPEYRMHDYSDAFAIVGVNPLSTALSIPDVITRIGDTYEEGDVVNIGDRNHTGDIIHTGNNTQTGIKTLNGQLIINNSGGSTSTGSGDLAWTGTLYITGDVVINGIAFSTHVHSGVTTGGDDTGVPE
jgi:hypothetical protein